MKSQSGQVENSPGKSPATPLGSPRPRPARGGVTQLLERWRRGDQEAFERLIPLVYDELRLVARGQLAAERPDHTLQPTALVHEAYFRMVGRDHPQWKSRSHFFAVSALVMRRVLIDHARGQNRLRRGSDQVRVDLADDQIESPAPHARLLALDEALDRLEREDPRKAQVVQLRFFGGLTLDEVAEVLQIAQVTVVRDWRMARAWLLRELAHGP
ncbi:MAG: sigma-70 family RNA polymerase sigma factor [Holophagales bacterium]|nr:sigma-70 family RNA polymerase sigma factor [Holophagales bacterium]